ncbi:MAG: hypothetical protein GC187_08335 [Alphaproteobacteria bacterium]|nr:hypothetical protein [Alphaproteobacteria bacterium]
MTLHLLSPPAAEPVSVDDAKTWLRITQTEEDNLLGGAIRAARERVEALTGRALIARGLRETLDDWPRARTDGRSGAVRLPAPPLISVEAVRIYGAAGAPELWSADEYQVDTRSDPGRIIPLAPFSLPRPGRRAAGIEIDFTAGYGLAPEDVPAPLREAVLRLAAHAYGGRLAPEAERGEGALPDGVAHLIRPYTRVRL